MSRCLVFLLLLTSVLTAADTTKVAPNFYPNNVGAGAGVVTGLGISYRHWFRNTWGMQINVAPFLRNDKDQKTQMLSAGLAALKIFKQSRFVNLIGYAGVSGFYLFDSTAAVDGEPAVITRDEHFYVGCGPGLDIHFWRLSFNIMTGLAFTFTDQWEPGLTVSGETALYFTF